MHSICIREKCVSCVVDCAAMPASPNKHGPARELLDAGKELLPASCTPDSPRPWSSRVEPGPIEDEEPLTAQRKRRIFLACACILVGNVMKLFIHRKNMYDECERSAPQQRREHFRYPSNSALAALLTLG